VPEPDPTPRPQDRAEDGFHVLNVVEGDGIQPTTRDDREHTLAYAETLVVPAATGAYAMRALGTKPALVVKAQVR
jgi:hypothetical protein